MSSEREQLEEMDLFIGHLITALSNAQRTFLIAVVDARLAGNNAEVDRLARAIDPADFEELRRRNFLSRDIDNPNQYNVQIPNALLAYRNRNPTKSF